MYLLIENPGEADPKSFYVWGASTAGPDNPRKIGMFGSGAKQAVATLMRHRAVPEIFCGSTKLEWGLRVAVINGKQEEEITVGIGGRAHIGLNFTLSYGQHDWTSIAMALREFVSNALDAVDGDASKVTLRITDMKPRAKAGHTRVFIWLGTSAPDWLVILQDQMFLHWQPKLNPYEGSVIPKRKPGPANFYRRGVLVAAWKGEKEQDSMWDYNFHGVKLDEARNGAMHQLQYEANKLLLGDPKKLVKTLMALPQAPDLWEGTIANPYMGWQMNSELVNEELSKAIDGNTVLCSTQDEIRAAKNKGLSTITIPHSWTTMLDQGGIHALASRKLSWLEREGYELLPVPDQVQALVKFWSGHIKAANLATQEDPSCHWFIRSDSTLKGFCRDTGIYLNSTLGGDELEMTILEELVHWYARTRDFTREFQEVLLRLTLASVKARRP